MSYGDESPELPEDDHPGWDRLEEDVMEINFDPELYSRERLEIYKLAAATTIVLALFLTIYMIARLFV